MSDPETLQLYAQKAAEYAALTNDANSGDPTLTRFISAVVPGGHVLDLGCGPGASAVVMAQNGLQVTAVDAVQEMVTIAAKHQGVTARVATFDQIEGTAIYDGVWANFSLLHAPRNDLPRHLSAIHQALKPGGAFHIAMKLGTDMQRDRLGRQYTYVTQDELNGLLTDAGFVVTDHKLGSGTGLDGSVADYIAMLSHA